MRWNNSTCNCYDHAALVSLAFLIYIGLVAYLRSLAITTVPSI